MTCNCIKDFDGKMEKQELAKIYMLDGRPTRVFISLYRKDKSGELEKRKGEPKYVAATFCPFCGQKYEGNDQ